MMNIKSYILNENNIFNEKNKRKKKVILITHRKIMSLFKSKKHKR